MDVWEDPILGHGGDYGFGGGGPTGYAFGVTNAPATVSSFYDQSLFETPGNVSPSLGITNSRVISGTQQSNGQVTASSARPVSAAAPPAQPAAQSWIGPALLVIAAIVLLK